MKNKLLLTLALTFIALVSFAQQPPNAGFETWTPQTGYNEPNGWGTANLLGSNGPIWGSANPFSVFKVGSPDVNGGTSAMKITTFEYDNSGFVDLTSYLPNDTLAFAFAGKIQSTAPYLRPGYAVTNRYAQFEFYSKYTPVGSDNAVCVVYLQRRVAGVVDTIAAGKIMINSTTSYTKYTVPLTYKNGYAPDTANIVFYSSGAKPQVGSTLWVDDVSFSGNVVGINEAHTLLKAISVYPNPATDNITLTLSSNNATLALVELFDVTGRQVNAVSVQGNKATVNTGNYAEGLYTYRAYNENKELIGIGKFNVLK